MRKLIISLPVLATILTAASTTTAAYGQEDGKGDGAREEIEND